MAKRIRLEDTMCELKDLQQTINNLKNKYLGMDTQIEVMEDNFFNGEYMVTIWRC